MTRAFNAAMPVDRGARLCTAGRPDPEQYKPLKLPQSGQPAKRTVPFEVVQGARAYRDQGASERAVHSWVCGQGYAVTFACVKQWLDGINRVRK